MSNKFFLILCFLCAGLSTMAAAELSGTYSKNFTVKTEFNTIDKGKTLRVTNGATFIMTDAIVSGNIVVEKGSSLIGPKDGEGYLVFSKGTHVEGIDLYYKVRVSENLVFTRKIPMTLDEIWKSGNKELIEWVSIIEFCYSSSLKGWVSINEIRYLNPFNENLYEDYDIVITKSASQVIEAQCRSLIVKNNSTLVVQPCKDYWCTKIDESITVESGSALLGTADGHKLKLKKGIKIDGLPLYVICDNNYIPADTILSDIMQQRDFNDKEYDTIYYSPDLKAWVFEERIYYNDIPSDLKKKIDKLKKK